AEPPPPVPQAAPPPPVPQAPPPPPVSAPVPQPHDAGAVRGAPRFPVSPDEPAAVGGEERRGGEEASVDSLFRRTPHMDLSAEEPLRPGQELRVEVFLNREEARAGETTQDVVVDIPEDVTFLEIEVMLAGTDHFEIRDECIKTLVVDRDEDESARLPFDLAVRAGLPDSPAALTAYLTYKHRPCGRVHRAVEVEGA